MTAARHVAGFTALLVAGILGLAGCSSSTVTSTSTQSTNVVTDPAPTSTVGSPGSGTAQPGVSPTPQSGGSRTVLAPLGINLRGDPSTAHPPVANLGEGALVAITGHTAGAAGSNGWYTVTTESGKTGYISDDPALSSPLRFLAYDSGARGLHALYPTSWVFMDTPSNVQFRPQTGVQVITVTEAPSPDGLGAPGRAGFGISGTDSVEVFGVTGVLRYYERGVGGGPATSVPLGGTPSGSDTGGVPSSGTSSDGTDQSTKHAEIRLTVDSTHAVRIDFDYVSDADLAIFTDFYHALYITAAARTPTPAPSTTAPTP